MPFFYELAYIVDGMAVMETRKLKKWKEIKWKYRHIFKWNGILECHYFIQTKEIIKYWESGIINNGSLEIFWIELTCCIEKDFTILCPNLKIYNSYRFKFSREITVKQGNL